MNTVERKLRERFCDPSRYYVSWDRQVASSLLFNLSGQVVGYQNYRWAATKQKDNHPKYSRYYTWVSKPRYFVPSDPKSFTFWDKMRGKARPWNCTYEKSRPVAVWGLETFHYRDDVL
jgi:hypothetical protein